MKLGEPHAQLERAGEEKDIGLQGNEFKWPSSYRITTLTEQTRLHLSLHEEEYLFVCLYISLTLHLGISNLA
jgi:hypothetical protein